MATFYVDHTILSTRQGRFLDLTIILTSPSVLLALQAAAPHSIADSQRLDPQRYIHCDKQTPLARVLFTARREDCEHQQAKRTMHALRRVSGLRRVLGTGYGVGGGRASALSTQAGSGGVLGGHRGDSRSLSSISQSIDLPPLPTKSEIDATIAAAEARAQQEAMAKKVSHMPIRAVHLARKMDIVGLFQKLYTDRFKISHFLHKDSIVLRLSGSHDQSGIVTGIVPPPVVPSSLTGGMEASAETMLNLPGNLSSRRAKDKWVVYFDYGAVVFFNCDQQLCSTLIKHATRFCQDAFEMRGHEEELLLIGNPALEKWSDLSDNNISVREIDHNNIHVIAGVLAQTVALEHYERQIEAILSEFERLNTAVERNGPRGGLFGLGLGDKHTERQQHKKLFQIVATNNTLLIDLVSKLRVIDRKRPGDAAWSYTRYHNMWESLVEDFELNERFNNLNFKLELIQHNTKFFLEVLGTHKGERMEWYIIILIAAELLISMYELAMKLRDEHQQKLAEEEAEAAEAEAAALAAAATAAVASPAPGQ